MIPACHRLRGALLSLLLVMLPHASHAQGRSHAYVFLGAGSAGLGGGVDWLIAGGPIGIGTELGIGQLLVASFTGSYHFLDGRSARPLDLFATAGFTTLTDLNSEARGVNVGGGAIYWPRKRVGLRLDCFSFLATHDNIRPEHRHYWGVRGGVAFSLR